MMTALPAPFYLLGHRFWRGGWMEVNFGGVVFFDHDDVKDYRRHDAAGYRRRARDDVRAQNGGVIWPHGGINGRPGKVDAWIPLGDGFVEDGGRCPDVVGLL